MQHDMGIDGYSVREFFPALAAPCPTEWQASPLPGLEVSDVGTRIRQ